MKTIDRIILSILGIGLWTIVILQLVMPINTRAIDIDADDIGDLKYFIENVVEDCRVRGEVYMHSVEYGEIVIGKIVC